MAENDVERILRKNLRQLSGVAAFDCDPLAHSGLDGRPIRQLQHRRRGIEQSDVNTEAREVNSGCSGSAAEIEGAERVRSPGWRQKFLEVCKRQVRTQPPFGSLEIRRVSARIVFEATLAFDTPRHRILNRSRLPCRKPSDSAPALPVTRAPGIRQYKPKQNWARGMARAGYALCKFNSAAKG